MALTDGELAATARQAAELLPGRAEVSIEPEPGDDPYGLGSGSYTVRFHPAGGGETGVLVSAGFTPVQALARMLDVVSEYGDEEPGWWGLAMPACPGHAHPARVVEGDGEVLLECPSTGSVVARIVPR